MTKPGFLPTKLTLRLTSSGDFIRTTTRSTPTGNQQPAGNSLPHSSWSPDKWITDVTGSHVGSGRRWGLGGGRDAKQGGGHLLTQSRLWSTCREIKNSGGDCFPPVVGYLSGCIGWSFWWSLPTRWDEVLVLWVKKPGFVTQSHFWLDF